MIVAGLLAVLTPLAVETWCTPGPYIVEFAVGSVSDGRDLEAIVGNAAGNYKSCDEALKGSKEPEVVNVVITGHVAVGEAEDLAIGRADTVRRYLMTRGVSTERIYLRSRGSASPRIWERPDGSPAHNGRVDIMFESGRDWDR